MSLSKGEIEAAAKTAIQIDDVNFGKNHMAAR